MYIEKIRINKFRVLEDINVRFQKPGGESADPVTGNVVNVVAGVNGTGKTSLLEALLDTFINSARMIGVDKKIEIQFGGRNDIDQVVKSNSHALHLLATSWKNANKDKIAPYEEPQSVFLGSQQNFNYNAVPQLTVAYRWAYRVNAGNVLGNAEFYIKEFVLKRERSSRSADPKERTKLAISEFNEIFNDAKLLTKLSDLDGNQFNRPVFSNAKNEKVTIDQLSDGEKQLYGRVLALMIIEPRNSIILIDEPEIALHPAWQQKIMQIYSRIGTNNQFIVATHSPQVIASVPYQNRILLRKDKGKIEPIHYSHPPTGVDVNSILAEVMGVESTLPEKVEDLHKTYRTLVEASEESTPEAKKVKEEILLHESNDSKFMQEMRFLIRLRGKK